MFFTQNCDVQGLASHGSFCLRNIAHDGLGCGDVVSVVTSVIGGLTLSRAVICVHVTLVELALP
jgi:hypothetical protein